MAAFVKFQDFVHSLGLKEHNLNTDTIKVYLTNNAPDVATDADKADLAGIAEQNGYAPADTTNTYTEAAGTGTLAGVDHTWTAAGGSFGPFRYVVLYNDTHAQDGLIGYWDYGSAITVNNGETFKTDFAASILTLA